MATTLKKKNQVYKAEQWQDVACPFCNSDNFSLFERFGPDNIYRYVICKVCGLVYLNPRPVYDDDFVETAYEEYNTDSDLYIKGVVEESDPFYNEQKFIVGQINQKLDNVKGHLLEIGCMTGYFLKAAESAGWNVIGLDVSKKMIEHINNNLGIEAYKEKYEDFEHPVHKQFDLIYCSHVIEHIPYPDVWFKKFRKDLKDTGLLVLNVPNQSSWDRRVKRFIQKNIKDTRKWQEWQTPDHMFEPALGPMKYIIEKNGFSVIDVFTYSKNEAGQNDIFNAIYNRFFKAGSKLRFYCRKKDL